MVSSFSFMSKQISGTFPWASSSIESYPSGNKHRVYKTIQLCWTVCRHCVSSRCCGTPFCVPVCVLESSVCSYWAEGRRSQKIRLFSPPQRSSGSNSDNSIFQPELQDAQLELVLRKGTAVYGQWETFQFRNLSLCQPWHPLPIFLHPPTSSFACHLTQLSTHPHSEAWTPVTDLWLLSSCHTRILYDLPISIWFTDTEHCIFFPK